VLATRNSTNGDLVLFVANPRFEERDSGDAEASEISAAAQAQVDTLAAESLATENSVTTRTRFGR